MKVKLKGKIMFLVLLPLVVMGVVIYLLGAARIRTVMTDTIGKGLHATTVAVRDTITVGRGGEFHVDENGELWKGDALNISQALYLADNVKEDTGMEVTIFFGDTRYMTSVVKADGTRATGTQASRPVIEAVLENGQNYMAEHVDIQGSEYFTYYIPLYDDSSEKPVGMVFAGISQEDAEAQINRIILGLLQIMLLVAVICALIVLLMVGKMAKLAKKGSALVTDVANGNLTSFSRIKNEERKIDFDKIHAGHDEIGEIIRAVQKLRESLISIISNIYTESAKLNTASVQLTQEAADTARNVTQVEQAVHEIAQSAGRQAEQAQEATGHVVMIGSMVEETAQEVERLHKNAGEMKKNGDRAAEILQELEQVTVKTRESIDIIYEQTNMTNESAEKIKAATELITDIAEETNLLSLNASIEAARAGEQGRGFAVVAGQIQKLAEQSNASAKKIEEIIASLIADSEKAVATMDEVKDIVLTQNEKIGMTGKMFLQVKQGIEQSISGIDAIAQKTDKMDSAREGVVDAVQSLSGIAQENAAGAQQTSASVSQVSTIITNISCNAEELKSISDDLQKSVEIFKLD